MLFRHQPREAALRPSVGGFSSSWNSCGAACMINASSWLLSRVAGGGESRSSLSHPFSKSGQCDEEMLLCRGCICDAVDPIGRTDWNCEPWDGVSF